tara:strand:+ start:582 stop:1439 length:858 start_codon:yes stop_codon:yes gene_type:complete
MIFITGITGRVGSSAARHLLKNGLGVKGLTRDSAKANDLAAIGADIVVGDISDNVVIKSALQGVTTVLLVTGNGPHQLEAECLIARESVVAGVKHIVKISSMEASPTATAPIPATHYKIEKYIEKTGLIYTFLRPNFFMQNLMLFAQSIKMSDQFSLPLGKAKTGIIDAEDVGEIAGRIASIIPQESSIRKLTGEVLLDFHEVADLISKELGKLVTYNEQSHDDFHALLTNTIPSPWHIEAVSLLFKEIANGALESTANDAQDILGRPLNNVRDFVARHKSAFLC